MQAELFIKQNMEEPYIDSHGIFNLAALTKQNPLKDRVNEDAIGFFRLDSTNKLL